MKKSEKSWTSVQWFKGLGTVFLIQARCLMSLEGNRMSFLAWIDLQIGFQIWVFKQNFQVCVRISGAALLLLALGLHSVLMYEWSRSKKSIKNLGIHVLQDLISKNLFKYFSCLFGTNHGQLSSILSKSSYARNIEYILCIKRFKT